MRSQGELSGQERKWEKEEKVRSHGEVPVKDEIGERAIEENRIDKRRQRIKGENVCPRSSLFTEIFLKNGYKNVRVKR